MAKFTQVRTDTWESIQINAGVLVSAFDPTTGSYNKSDILGATNGGVSFNTNPEYTDFGEDIDNVPANTKQLKRVQSYNPELSGTFAVVDTALGKKLIAAADIDSDNTSHIIPRNALTDADFGDLWLIGDYSTKNGNTNGGFVAVHVKNALSTGGFQWQTAKDGKGQFAFTFTGHYDLEDIDEIPFEMYIKAGADEKKVQVGTQPNDEIVEAGETAHFFASAARTSSTTTWSPAYQWQVRATTDNDYSDISGKETPSLSLSSVTAAMSGNKYRCKITNDGDTVYSNSATLTVLTGA